MRRQLLQVEEVAPWPCRGGCRRARVLHARRQVHRPFQGGAGGALPTPRSRFIGKLPMHHRFPSPAVPTPLRRAPKRAVPAHPNPRVWLTRGTERVQRRLRTTRLAAGSPGLYAAPWGSRAQQRLLRIFLLQQIGDGARQRRGQLARRQRHSSQAHTVAVGEFGAPRCRCCAKASDALTSFLARDDYALGAPPLARRYALARAALP